MLKILKLTSVMKVKNALPQNMKDRLEILYFNGTTDEDRQEFKLDDFLTDLVGECAYRDENGVDGNWIEFAATWELMDQDYEVVLRAMVTCGYHTGLQKW